jgi:hypothetical protein
VRTSQQETEFRVIQETFPSTWERGKAFADWSKVFADDPIMASAALDRLLHRSTVINFRGESYRLKKKRAAVARGPSCPSVPAHFTSGSIVS